MLRGEIRLVDFDPALSGEAANIRAAVIVSNDGANTTASRLGRGVVTVAPVTSNIAHVYPFQMLLTSADSGLRTDSKVQAEQVRSVSVDRVGGQVGTVPPALMLGIDEALRLHLAL